MTRTKPLDGFRILIAEDDADLCALMKDEFEYVGANVTTAQDGLEAQQKITEFEFAAVVSDFNMPGANGAELLRSFRAKNSAVFVLLLTANASFSEADAVRDGATLVFSKPADLSDVINKITLALKT